MTNRFTGGMLRLYFLIVPTLMGAWNVRAQSIGDFRSHQSGNWNSTNTWERWQGASWATPAPSTPTSSDGTITIQTNHVVTVTASVTADQIVIQSSGQL